MVPFVQAILLKLAVMEIRAQQTYLNLLIGAEADRPRERDRARMPK
jgi:hypothetical protein